MKKTGQQSSTADRPPAEATTPPAVPLWQAIALDQLAAANRALIALEAARWDPTSHSFRIPRGGVLDDFIRIPPEFARDIGLGRLHAAIRERVTEWQGVVDPLSVKRSASITWRSVMALYPEPPRVAG